MRRIDEQRRHSLGPWQRAATPALVASAIVLAAAPAAAQHPDPAEAEAVVRSLHAALIETAAADEALTRAERFARLEPAIVATHDLDYIAELTVRRQWRDLGVEQRHAFVSAFRRLSVMTYATRFATVDATSFEIHGSDDAGGGRVQVRAAIVRRDAEDVSLDYVLHHEGGRWRIINILADRVSDLALKRAQYQKIFSDGGSIADVIAEIEAETEKL